MPEKAVISHRGERYEIGRGKRFYGIWVVGAPYDAPVDRWPENRDGWQQAWARFSSLEAPTAITPVARERKGSRLRIGPSGESDAKPGADVSSAGEAAARRSRHGSGLLAGEGLLVLGVVLGLAGLFPAYEGGQSLLSQWDQVVPHLLYVIGWAVTAALVALSVARPSKAARLGGLFGLGLSAVTFGLFLADWGQLSSSGVTFGTGLLVSTLSWAACTAGAGLVLGASRGGLERRDLPSRPVRPGRDHVGPIALLALGGIGTAAAFAPSWDRYVLTAAATGVTQTVTAGNAFDNPGLTIAGNVSVMVAVVAVAAVAALWRPAKHGAWLLAGAIVPLAAEIISAVAQVSTAASPSLFDISPSEATSLGLKVSSGLTGSFWVFFVFVISLLVSCAWLFTEPGHQVMPAIPVSPWQPAGGDQGTHSAADASADEDADSDASDDVDGDDTDSGAGTVDSGAGTGDGGTIRLRLKEPPGPEFWSQKTPPAPSPGAYLLWRAKLAREATQESRYSYVCPTCRWPPGTWQRRQRARGRGP